MSKGYVLGSGEPHPFEIVGPAPAGALSSPAEDMAHFMIAQLQDGQYNGNRILSAETAETMHNSPLTVLPPLNRMELGFFETNINGREVIAHLGDTEYFHTSLHLFLKENVGFYVSFNSRGKDGAAGTLRNALFFEFSDRYFPSDEKDGQVDKETAARHAAMLSGRWVNSRGSQSDFLAVVGLLGQTKAGVNAKGELMLPFLGLNGKPRHWVEIVPFVWRDSNGHDRLAAKVIDGKTVRFSFDELSPFMVFDRVPWYKDGAWLTPALCVGLGALAITALLWPIAAIVRRRYGATLALDSGALRSYRWSKIGAIVILAGLALWAWTISRMLNDNSNLGAKFDSWLLFTQVFGAIAFIGGSAAILWNLRTVWAGNRSWPAKTWSIVLALAAAVVLWTGFAFKLISFGLNY
jgi:hypothetical protein